MQCESDTSFNININKNNNKGVVYEMVMRFNSLKDKKLINANCIFSQQLLRLHFLDLK